MRGSCIGHLHAAVRTVAGVVNYASMCASSECPSYDQLLIDITKGVIVGTVIQMFAEISRLIPSISCDKLEIKVDNEKQNPLPKVCNHLQNPAIQTYAFCCGRVVTAIAQLCAESICKENNQGLKQG